MTAGQRRIGILAGGGTLPREFADAAAAGGAEVQIVALKESAEADFGPYPVERVSMGQVGKILRTFRCAQVDGIVIIGPVRRADLTRMRPDGGFFSNIPAILKIVMAGGDDGALSGVVRFFEAKGLRVLGPADVAPQVLAPTGQLAGPSPPSSAFEDAHLGFRIIEKLAPYDIGQAAVIRGGLVEAIEAAEGTNVMLDRVRSLRASKGALGTRNGVLVKRPKPGQEIRVDTPSIGPGTVTRVDEAGLVGIVVQAGGVLVAERQRVKKIAEAAGLFVFGADGNALIGARGSSAERRMSRPYIVPGFSELGQGEARDAEKALSIMNVLEPYACGTAIVVARGHVLGVEAGGEEVTALLQRVELYRKRHGVRSIRRSGTLLVRDASLLTEAVMCDCVSAGLRAAAVATLEPTVPEILVEMAHRLGLRIAPAARRAGGGA